MESCDLGIVEIDKKAYFPLGVQQSATHRIKQFSRQKKIRSSIHEYSSEKLLEHFSSRELNKYLTQKNIGAKKLIISIKNSSKGLFSILFMEGIYLRKIGNFN
jgi:hypothetical protein